MHIGIKNEIFELSKIYDEFWGLIVYTKRLVFIDSGAEISKSLKEGIVPQLDRDHGKIYAIVKISKHTQFILEDEQLSEASKLPFYHYSNDLFEYFPKSYKPNLQNLPFIWGLFDCAAMIRHYFIWKRRIIMKDYDRDSDVIEKDMGLLNKILKDGVLSEYFYDTKDRIMLEDDLLVFKSNRGQNHHLGIFVGNGKMIHHPLNAESSVVDLGYNYLKSLKHVYRLK
jgi:hypothetical protein